MLIEIRQGLDVSIAGAPEQRIYPGQNPGRVAVMGMDHLDLRPTLDVRLGERVLAGQTLFVDRADARVCYTAPATGSIAEINRGPKRSLLSIVIELEADDPIRVPIPGVAPAALTREQVCETLLAAGLWPALRARPYGRVARTSAVPAALFVTAIDTNPLAADPQVIVSERADDFAHGLAVVGQLAPSTFLCTGPSAQLPDASLDGLVRVEFAGRHPAGLVGTHMHHLHRDPGEAWHIGYQDVLAIGQLFSTGVVSTERVISLAGPGVRQPRLVRTRLGADLGALLDGEVESGSRIVSGSVLSGRAVTPGSGYLGRYHDQVSVLPDAAVQSVQPGLGARLRRLLLPGLPPTWAGWQSTAAHGSPGGMLALEEFDRVWPFAAPPAPLLRALLLGDSESATALGCLALCEDDLALCTYVCAAKLNYGAALRGVLREIERGR